MRLGVIIILTLGVIGGGYMFLSERAEYKSGSNDTSVANNTSKVITETDSNTSNSRPVASDTKEEIKKGVPESLTLTNKKVEYSDLSYRISVGSQVQVHIYDSQSRHTGIIPADNITTDLDSLDEEIPNSSYLDFGSRKYITVYLGDTYKIAFKSKEADVFDVELEEDSSGNSGSEIIYKNIPIDARSDISFQMSPNGEVLPMSIDIDGDGTVELNLPAKQNISKVSLINISEYLVNKIGQPSSIFRKYDKSITIEKPEEVVSDTDLKRVEIIWENLITLTKDSKITRENATDLLGILYVIKPMPPS